MIKKKDAFVAFVDALPIADSSKRTYRGWVNRIEKNHPKEISCRTVQSEEDVHRLAKSMPKNSYVGGHFKDVLCIIRYYLRFCLDEGVKVQQDLAEIEGEFLPTSPADARTKVMRSIALRRGQQKFRHQLMDAYGRKCCVTGTEMSDVLEAAHICPYAQGGTNSVNNGLLLRADIHVLFDLRHLSINPSTKEIYCAKRLRASQYAAFNGKKIEFPAAKRDWPDHEALQRHFEETKD